MRNITIKANKMVLEDIEVAPSPHNWLRAGIGHLLNETTQKGMISLADQAVVSATNFLTGVIIGRACIKEEFGLYMLGFSIVFFVTNLQTSIISTPYMVISPRLKGSEHIKYTGSILIHQLTLSALTILALTIGGGVLSLGVGPQGLAPVVWTLVIVIMFITLRECVRQISFASLWIKTTLLLDSSVTVVQISGLIFLYHLGRLSANSAYWVVGFACGIAVLGWLILNRNSFVLFDNQAISAFRRNWSFGKWVFASSLVWTLTINLYPWFLTAFHGTASAGVWAACLGIVSIGNTVLLGIQNVLGPKITNVYAKDGDGALKEYVLKVTAIFVLLTTPLCCVMFFFGGSLAAMVYGEKYAGNGMVVFALVLNFLIVTATFPCSRALFAMERAKADFKASFISLFFLLAVGIWLLSLFGTVGAAFALMLGNVLGLAVRYVNFSRVLIPATQRKTNESASTIF